MNNDLITCKIVIKGRVQGIGFRHWFNNLAIFLNLNGYIQNQKNRNEVEAIVQGKMKNIQIIINKSNYGPEFAIVEKVTTIKIPNEIKYLEFKVKY